MDLKNQIAGILNRLGVSAACLTISGLLFALGSGFLIYRRALLWAAATLLASGLCDLLDGAVARQANQATAFGGILDSSLDRYGDAFVFAGLLFYYARQQNYLYTALTFSALIGSFSISYVRARAECEMDSCRVGFWERGERIGFLICGLCANNPALVLWVLGIAAHWTAVQRILYSSDTGKYSNFLSRGRSDFRYFLKLIFLVLAVLFIRPN